MTINYELTPLRKDGTYGIRIIICNGRGSENRKRISTNLVAQKKDVSIIIDKVHAHAKKKIKNQELLDKLQEFIIQCRKNYNDNTIVKKEKMKTKEAVDLMLNRTSLPKFFEFVEQWLANCHKQGKKNYVTAKNSFANFLGGRDIEFKDITYSLLTQYLNSLDGKPRAQSEYLSAIKHFWEEAERMYDDDLPKSPFRKFKVPKQKPKGQRAVDADTIRQIIAYDPVKGSRAELARDCYILSFAMMGMNAADLYDCSYYKKGILKYDRVKTRGRRDDAHMEIDVPDYIKPLFEKYKDATGNKVFSFYQRFRQEKDFTRSLNIGLKAIFGENSTITFYTARHSWATIARNEIGASKSDVNDGLVHVDRGMDITDIYIKRDYRAVNRLNQEVLAYILKNPDSHEQG